MSVFDVAYLQTRSFGTNECALGRHRDGHLVLASDHTDTRLPKSHCCVPQMCCVTIVFGCSLPKSNSAPVCPAYVTVRQSLHARLFISIRASWGELFWNDTVGFYQRRRFTWNTWDFHCIKLELHLDRTVKPVFPALVFGLIANMLMRAL